MALESRITFGAFNPTEAKKEYSVVDSRMIFNRPYNKYTPLTTSRLYRVEVILRPEPNDLYIQRWFKEKTPEDVYLCNHMEIGVFVRDTGYWASKAYKQVMKEAWQIAYMKNAVCYTLSETMVKVGEEGTEYCRQLTVGIESTKLELIREDELPKLAARNRAPEPVAAPEPKFVPKDPSKMQEINRRAQQFTGNLTNYEKLKIAENTLLLDQQWGIVKGDPMTIEEADTQNANILLEPDTIVDPNDPTKTIERKRNKENADNYLNNCAFCSNVYALRLLGYDVTARGFETNNYIQVSNNGRVTSFWRNMDGTHSKEYDVQDWMMKKGFSKMSTGRWRQFLEDGTKEEGVYLFSLNWKSKGGHFCIIQRWKDEQGQLHLSYIEPQKFDPKKGTRRDVYPLCKRLNEYPRRLDGYLLRVDNKLFIPEGYFMFYTNDDPMASNKISRHKSQYNQLYKPVPKNNPNNQ